MKPPVLPFPPPAEARAAFPSQEGPDKAPRTDSDTLSSQVAYVHAFYSLTSCVGCRVFANRAGSPHALHLLDPRQVCPSRGKPAPWERLSLVVVIWEHNTPRYLNWGMPLFTPGGMGGHLPQA
ncbi:hypothetical protein GWK47_027719 [Chionoecetes opilio]|uniref:Uncharacterized protein n=1 Tax=Chionoecetes opilio TaxID=41210 RepID=A0A8J8W953_CHIOP|nr:hypothetical protein GWK47_027719 [Chionoecetes opilio]